MNHFQNGYKLQEEVFYAPMDVLNRIIDRTSRQEASIYVKDNRVLRLKPSKEQIVKKTYAQFCQKPYTYRSCTVGSPHHIFVTVKNRTLSYNLFKNQQFQSSKTIRLDEFGNTRQQVKSIIIRLAPNASFNVHLQDPEPKFKNADTNRYWIRPRA